MRKIVKINHVISLHVEIRDGCVLSARRMDVIERRNIAVTELHGPFAVGNVPLPTLIYLHDFRLDERTIVYTANASLHHSC